MTPAPPPRIRVLIVDDQALIRRGMSLMISLEPDMEVVGEAADGLDAIALAAQLRPDVVLMDLNMPRMGGVAATREIVLARPESQVLVLTTFDADDMVFDALRAGARGYLLKDTSEAEVLDAVRGLHRAESRLTPSIARKVLDQFRDLADAAGRRAGSEVGHGTELAPAEALNEREESILRLISAGKSNRQIADTVFLAEGTVKNYVSRIMEKLHAASRTELAVIALRQRR